MNNFNVNWANSDELGKIDGSVARGVHLFGDEHGLGLGPVDVKLIEAAPGDEMIDMDVEVWDE